MDYNLDFGYVWDYSGALWNGLMYTLMYTAISLFLGFIVGFLTSISRLYGGAVVSTIATGYVELFRGTPVLVQLFWFMFCLPALLGIEVDSAVSTVVTLSLYLGAISSESFRASLKVIGREQSDACQALGLSAWISTVYIILPQAVLRAIPNLLSNTVTLFKESALVSAMGVGDLMYQSQTIAEISGRPVEILTVAAGIYFVIAFALTRIVSLVETRALARLSL